MDNYFVLFGSLLQCPPTEPGGNQTRNLSLETKSLTAASWVPVLDIEFQLHQLKMQRELLSIVSYVILTYSGKFGTEIHNVSFAMLKSSKQNETAVQCSGQFAAVNFTD